MGRVVMKVEGRALSEIVINNECIHAAKIKIYNSAYAGIQ